jgi:CRISPR-associated exonuclease Cas4
MPEAVAAGLDRPWFTVTDVRNYLYCQRLLHYRFGQPVRKRLSFKMQEGVLMHQRAGALERRRSLRAYGLTDGDRRFGVELVSERLGVRGKLDMLIERRFEALPVEFKHAHAKRRTNHRYQLTLYALLAEELAGAPVRRGFLFYLVDGAVEEVLITEGMRRFVTRTLDEMRRQAASETLPAGTRRLGKCAPREYLHFCNDRW